MNDSKSTIRTAKEYEWNGSRIPEKRCLCHMSQEVNELFAEQVAQSLTEGQWRSQTLPDRLAHSQPWSYYYASRDPAAHIRLRTQ